jgi:UDPglucose--hexose-1-phosphate uridylyltransferase
VPELRFDPLLGSWVAYATARNDRTFLPTDFCPLCPSGRGGPGEVPLDAFDVVVVENRFPAFGPQPDPGACEVVVYTPDHRQSFAELSPQQALLLVDVWVDRYLALGARPDVAYVYIFENKGEEIGVTLHHPHGQIYAMPFVPPTIRTEVDSLARYASRHTGACLFCDLLSKETKARERIVAENDAFVAFVPFAARFPAEGLIYPRRHLRYLTELTDLESQQLADLISLMRRKYDNLYGFQLPLMMLVKQAPTREHAAPYHFHVQFLPLQRSATKHKYLASIETGFGTFLADTSPEDMAAQLRQTAPVG